MLHHTPGYQENILTILTSFLKNLEKKYLIWKSYYIYRELFESEKKLGMASS